MSTGDYTLDVRVDHMRRPSMSSLLYSLAYRALAEERAGVAWEQVHCHLTGDGDYAAIAVVDPAGAVSPAVDGSATTRVIDDAGRAVSTTTETSDDVAEDDITAAEEARNGAQREADEAARLQAIELQKQLDAYALRRQAAGHDD